MRHRWERYVLAAAAVTLLVVATIAAAPGVRIATGDSMEPTISGPAVVVCNPGVAPESIEEGDIVAAPRYSETGTVDNHSVYGPTDDVVMHRVIETDALPPRFTVDNALRLQGDNNPHQTELTSADAVICTYEWHVTLDPSTYL